MYGYQSLKKKIVISEDFVECPVKDCYQKVQRQRKSFQYNEKYMCPTHQIYITPSTFVYLDETENLLWKADSDIKLLDSIKTVKREHRFNHDNSEDAVSWNVFRFIEVNHQLDNLLSYISNHYQRDSDLIYWSFSQSENKQWTLLNKARLEFGERLNRSSEPDLIVTTENTLFFIEAKLKASNITTPSNPKKYKKYLTGGDQWFNQIFKTDFNTIAIVERKYELLRFWLLGSWLSKCMNLNFCLINIVRDVQDLDIADKFSKLIYSDDSKKFIRFSWEEIYSFIRDNSSDSPEKEKISNYYHEKTIGYNSDNVLVKAFRI